MINLLPPSEDLIFVQFNPTNISRCFKIYIFYLYWKFHVNNTLGRVRMFYIPSFGISLSWNVYYSLCLEWFPLRFSRNLHYKSERKHFNTNEGNISTLNLTTVRRFHYSTCLEVNKASFSLSPVLKNSSR